MSTGITSSEVCLFGVKVIADYVQKYLSKNSTIKMSPRQWDIVKRFPFLALLKESNLLLLCFFYLLYKRIKEPKS